MYEAIAGFGLGLSLIMAVGAQNVFVLRQGILRSNVLLVCLTCAISDAVLISAGIGGFAWASSTIAWLEPFLRVGGAVFLLFYGGLSAYRAFWQNGVVDFDGPEPVSSALAAFSTCLALTWLNPHVYLDNVVLIGSLSTQYDSRAAFAIGAVLASFAFFLTLGYGAGRLAPIFEKARAWAAVDAAAALIMWGIAVKLLLG